MNMVKVHRLAAPSGACLGVLHSNANGTVNDREARQG